MNTQNIIFGTDGWRGLLDQELNPANIIRVAQAFAVYIAQKGANKRVAIGFDGRRDSDVFAGIFAEVLAGNRIEVLLSDRIIPTPVVSFTVVHEQCDAGVMITASHNPPQYNGIKFKSAKGSPFFTEDTALVESLIDTHPPKRAQLGVHTIDLTAAYIQHVEKLIDFQLIARSGLKVAIDSMAGAGGQMLENILKKHGISAETIFGEPKPDFDGRLAEPIAANLQPLSAFLKKKKFSLGLATDGDADRLGVMSGNGGFMNVQETILYLAQYYRQKRGISGSLVKTASVTDKILDLFPGREADVVDVQVGFKYVAEAMMQHQAAFGAEESGGFGFKEHLPERDGIFSGLVFLEMLAADGSIRLETFIEKKRGELGKIYYDRIDMASHDPRRHEVLPGLSAMPPDQINGFRVLQTQAYFNSRGIINGLKLRFEGNPRWLLLRVSETEPMIRIYAEAQSDEEVKAMLAEGKKLFVSK